MPPTTAYAPQHEDRRPHASPHSGKYRAKWIDFAHVYEPQRGWEPDAPDAPPRPLPEGPAKKDRLLIGAVKNALSVSVCLSLSLSLCVCVCVCVAGLVLLCVFVLMDAIMDVSIHLYTIRPTNALLTPSPGAQVFIRRAQPDQGFGERGCLHARR